MSKENKLIWRGHVNHPSHYNTGKIEVIDFIEDQQLGFHLGNAVKYICRAGKKNTDATSIDESRVTDLEKAVWYIQRYITVFVQNSDIPVVEDSEDF